jgi:DNA-binding LacI/PurR family transcriptional regulator
MKKNSYKTIYEELLKQIRRGDYRTGELLPTDNQFAAKFSVSRPTVARALAMLADEGLVGRKAGYGTFITRVPRSFQRNVGLIIPGLGKTEIFEPICSKIAECFDCEDVKFHWTASSGAHGDKKETALRLCQSCIEQNLDGVFFTPIEHTEGAESINTLILNQLNDAQIQTVLLDRDVLPWPRQTPHDLVGIDNIQAGFVVTRHLIENRCRSFLFVTESIPATTVRLRIMGCREALLQSKLPAESFQTLETAMDDPGTVAEIILQNSPDALICANDATAAALMRSLIDKGASIPDRLKVAAFDDVRYASLLSVPLTTYHQPCTEIGTTAAATMLERLKNPTRSPRRISLKGHLVIRQSSAIQDTANA